MTGRAAGPISLADVLGTEPIMPALLTDASRLDAHRSFWDFVASRPDEEKWELIEGRFVMQAQPSIDHQIIAGNLDRRLSEGLDGSARTGWSCRTRRSTCGR
ncbi:Uma2 family endonuclease [Methylobacterium sp. WL93]|uniref:Uma2 family endonuclease n=2 Tax=Methylobacterium TaxID=407 RepID=UPI001FF06AA4|nr:Uma2 family endonuclease [Methylobacterium sp. WL93]